MKSAFLRVLAYFSAAMIINVTAVAVFGVLFAAISILNGRVNPDFISFIDLSGFTIVLYIFAGWPVLVLSALAQTWFSINHLVVEENNSAKATQSQP